MAVFHTMLKTISKFKNYAWYLSEDLIALSLFDDNVPHLTKNNLVLAMKTRSESKNSSKRASITPQTFHDSTTLADFASKRSAQIFSKLRLPDGFLEMCSSEWETNGQYQEAKAVVGSLAVVNDHAERGVALVKEYSGRLTKDEDQFQYLLKLVADNRRKYVQSSKKALLGANERLAIMIPLSISS